MREVRCWPPVSVNVNGQPMKMYIFTNLAHERFIDMVLLSTCQGKAQRPKLQKSFKHIKAYIANRLFQLIGCLFAIFPYTRLYIPAHTLLTFTLALHTLELILSVRLMQCSVVSGGPEQIWTDPCDLNRRPSRTGFGERLQGERLPSGRHNR